ncbi:MAG: Fur family transcriptional regulator [Cytophagaceae bacterium]
MVSTAKKILQNHHIKITSTRINVLEVFLSNKKVMTLQDISGSLPDNFDRVTLYRVLNTFESNGVIHRIPDPTGNVNYALCHHDCTPHVHKDDHVHFKCTKCLNTFCLDHVKIPEIRLDNKFSVTKLNYLLEGICDKCHH